MTYCQQWKKHNSSINALKNNAIYCVLEHNLFKVGQPINSNNKKTDSIASNQIAINKYRATNTVKRDSLSKHRTLTQITGISLTNFSNLKSFKVFFDVGLKSSIICFNTELTSLFLSSIKSLLPEKKKLFFRKACKIVGQGTKLSGFEEIAKETGANFGPIALRRLLCTSLRPGANTSRFVQTASKSITMFFDYKLATRESRHMSLNKNVKNFELLKKTTIKNTNLMVAHDYLYNLTISNRKSNKLFESVLRKLPINPKVSIVKIANLEIFREPYFILPKIFKKKVGKQQAWVAIWKRFVLRNIVRGFLLNSVKGGYAVAIGKYIAFLPRSLRLEREERIGQYRFFEILNMRSNIKNIVVKEVAGFIKGQNKPLRKPLNFVKPKKN